MKIYLPQKPARVTLLSAEKYDSGIFQPDDKVLFTFLDSIQGGTDTFKRISMLVLVPRCETALTAMVLPAFMATTRFASP